MSGSGLVHLLLLHLEGTQVNWQGRIKHCMFTVVPYCENWEVGWKGLSFSALQKYS